MNGPRTPMDDALGLGVVPQQIALVVGQFAHSALSPRHLQPSKKQPGAWPG